VYVLGHSGNFVDEKARDLASKIGPDAARLLDAPEVLSPRRKAESALQSAQSLLVYHGKGLGVMPSKITEPEDPKKRQELETRINEVFQSIEQTLKAIEAIIAKRREQSKLTRATPFIFAVLLLFVSLAAFVWGMLYGSRITLFGSGGACVFSLTLGFAQVHKYNREQLALDTLIQRTRLKVVACKAGNFVEMTKCLNEALGTLNQYFTEITAVAKKAKARREGS
jgi:hypothetical protein